MIENWVLLLDAVRGFAPSCRRLTGSLVVSFCLLRIFVAHGGMLKRGKVVLFAFEEVL
jgi:hypothetical protein